MGARALDRLIVEVIKKMLARPETVCLHVSDNIGQGINALHPLSTQKNHIVCVAKPVL